jgi:hypothetical protein
MTESMNEHFITSLTFGCSESTAEIADALAKAQLLIQPAIKDNTNPHFRSKYAGLPEVMQACLPHLNANGIAVIQAPSYSNGIVKILTRLNHRSGQWIQSELAVPVTKQDAQGVGSAITYGRRYSLSSMVGVIQDDDDGNAAVAQPVREQSKVNAVPALTGDYAVAAISTTTSLEDLRNVYTSAMRAAGTDEEKAALTAVKDARKNELTK